MNVRKTVIVAGGSLLILILLGIRLGWFGKLNTSETPEKKTPSTLRKAEKTKPIPVKKAHPRGAEPVKNSMKKALPPPAVKAPLNGEKKAPRKAEQDLGVGDPFAYASSSSGDYTPLSGNRNVGAIAVKGIICMAGEEPKAILHLKESDRVHYVSKNSVVRVSGKGRKGAAPAEAYIVVKEIRNDEVELIQLERPDKVIIIR